MTNIIKKDITGVILAGGQARRMQGTDKGLVKLGGQPMIQHVINRIQPQVNHLLIYVNRSQRQYAEIGLNIIEDEIGHFDGPLAGFYTAMKHCNTSYLLMTPCDSPFIPNYMVKKLGNKLSEANADISVVETNQRLQPVFCLLKSNLIDSLEAFLKIGERKIDKWFSKHNMVAVDFTNVSAAFNNINTPEDLMAAEDALKSHDY